MYNKNKNYALKLTEVLLITQAFVNYCSFCQVKWNKNDNVIQNKIYTDGIKCNEETYSDVMKYKNKHQQRLRLVEYSSTVNYSNSKKIQVCEKMACKLKTMQNNEKNHK